LKGLRNVADKTDDLIISISTDLATVRRSLKRLETDIAGSTKVIERQFDGLGKRIDSSLTRSFVRAEAGMARLGRAGADAQSKFAKVFAAGASARGAQSLIDSATKIQNSLKVAGLEGENLKSVYDSLFASANRNGAPLEELATLYSKAASAAKEFGGSQADVIKFTDTVAVSLRAGGGAAQAAAGALLQLSQALGSSRVQQEEFGSLIDGARPLLQAVAAGIDEAGGSVDKLTRLVKDGKLSNKAFFDAAIAGAPMLEKALASSERTISSRFQVLQNVMVDAAKRFNEGANAGNAFGEAIDSISNEIATADFAKLSTQLKEISGYLSAGATGLQSWSEYIGKISGLDNIGKAIAGPNGRSFLGGALTINSTTTPEEAALETAKKRLEIEKEIAGIKADPAANGQAYKLADAEARLAALPSPPKRLPGITQPAYALPGGTGVAPTPPIKLSDPKYAVTDPAETEKLKNAYRDLMKSADDRLGQLRQEIDLLGIYGTAAETARFKLDLLQSSEDKGRSLSEDQRTELEKKVALYGQYADMLGKAKLQQDLLDERRFKSLSSEEQQVFQKLREYGRPTDLNSDDANAIRKNLRIDSLSGGIHSFLTDFSSALQENGGDIGKSFATSIQRPICGAEINFNLHEAFA
jgi:tape measure domain-containing protein